MASSLFFREINTPYYEKIKTNKRSENHENIIQDFDYGGSVWKNWTC